MNQAKTGPDTPGRSIDADRLQTVRRIAEALSLERGALLPILHAVQHELGHVDDGDVATIANVLNISRAEVHGVITFYHDFRRSPAGRHVIKLCRAESCQARGGTVLEQAATDNLGVAMGETSGDGRVTLEPVFCLGLCSIGPNAMIDGVPHARLDGAKLERILKGLAA